MSTTRWIRSVSVFLALRLLLSACSQAPSDSATRDTAVEDSYASDPVFWSDSYMGHNEAERCRTNDDPFDIPAYVFARKETFPGNMINFNPINAEHPADLGRCLWRNHYRPVIKLSQAGQKAFGLYEDSGHIVVANVRHFDKFYVARIPYKKTTNMNMMRVVSEMPVLGNRGSHAEMRTFFSEPVVLTPQWPLNPARSFTVDQLVFTGNPVGAEELSRRIPQNNLDGSVLHARGIHTIDSKIKEHFVDFPSETIAQFRMTLNVKERENYIRKYTDLANAQRFGRHFLLFSLNCTYSQFEVLDSILGHRYAARSTPFDPNNLVKNLEARQLIDHEVSLPNIEDEEHSKELFQRYPRVYP